MNWCIHYTILFLQTSYYNDFSILLRMKNVRCNRIETKNDYAYKLVKNINREAGNHVLVTFSWRWDHGFKSKSQDTDVDNRDTDSGILK